MLSSVGQRSSWLSGLVIFAVIGWAGCSSSGLPSDAAAVEGTVTFDGEKVAGAVVTFRSDSGFAAVGKTDEQGKYHLTSPSIPGGTQPGNYQVTVVKREPLSEAPLTEEDPNYNPNRMSSSSQPRKHLLPEKYSKPTTSDLTADVEAGQNTIDLKLSK